MTSSEYPVVLTVEGAAGGDGELVDSNVAVVNTMYQELLGSAEIAPPRPAQLLRGLLPDAVPGRHGCRRAR
ncbi:hypothetical protein QF036_004730 [Arthrobacter globiformis]|nr:hypothetical protein [Arthrobacter globiformis]